MATTRTFSAMLNEYLPNELLKEELVKRDYLLQKVEKDDSWAGGTLVVPFKAAGGSSVAFGSLTDSSDIGEDSHVRGSITSQPEVWGSMKFNHRDLMEHGKVSEQNFLKILPDALEDFMSYMKSVVSQVFLNGGAIAKLTVDATANDGLVTVDRPERLVLNQKVIIDDNNSTPLTGYVKTIAMDTGVVLLVTARGGATPVDFSAGAGAANMTVAQGAALYYDGVQSNGLTSLKSSLLSLANGGDTNLYGVAKTSAPFLQAINVSGSDITAANIIAKIFAALTVIKNRGKGSPNTILVSYKHLGSIMAALETARGAFHSKPENTKVSNYGWTEIEVMSVQGVLKIVATQEMNDSEIHVIDWRAMKIHSNGFFKKRQSPDGDEFFETRATTGYSYIVDMCFFGDLVVNRPSYCGIIHSISY